MKIFIIILVILFLLYFTLKKQEKFTVKTGDVKVTQEMRDRIVIEKINNEAREDMSYISYRDYINIETENNITRFMNMLSDKEKKMNFFINDLAIEDRTLPLARSFNTNNNEKSYFQYINFKKLSVPTDSLDEKYQNPNNIDYASLFLEAFKPNVILKVFFKKPENEIRMRYQIRKRQQNRIISSSYLAAKRLGVRNIENNQIQLHRSPLTHRYEPTDDLLVKGSFMDNYREAGNKTYGNYLSDVHKLTVDVIQAQEDSEYNQIKKNYEEGKYLMAFEDFNKVELNYHSIYDGDFTYLEKGEKGIETKKILKPANQLSGRSLLYDDKIARVESFIYMSPGEYTIDLILDRENDKDFEDGVMVSMEYQFNNDYSREDSIVKDRAGRPISLLHFDESRFMSSGSQDDSNFLKSNITNLISELNYLEKKIRNKRDKSWILHDNFYPLEPERWVMYAKTVLFYILLEFNKKKGIETNNYNNTTELLENFKIKYRAERLETRYVKEPSRTYKYYLDRQKELVMMESRTVQEQQELNNVSEKLMELLPEELSRPENGGPLGPDKFKIQHLEDFYNQMADYKENKEDIDSLFADIKDKTGGNFKKNFSKILDVYIHHYLKPEGDTTSVNNFKLTSENLPNYFNNLRAAMEVGNPDIDGKTPLTEKSDKKLSEYLKTPRVASFDIKIEIKRDMKIIPVFDRVQPAISEEPKPDEEKPVDEFTALVRRVLVLVKKDFRKIIKNKNYEYLSSELELILKNIYNSSKRNKGERADNYRRTIEIILNLVGKIRDGSIDDLNDLLDLDIDNYMFPNEVIQENFSNYNTMNPDIIETFDSGYHKHTADGRINFELEWGNPLVKENEGRYDEYSLLSDQSKNQVIQSYDKMENALKQASSMVNNYVEGMDKKMKSVDLSKINQDTNDALEKVEKSQSEKDQDYKELENKQNSRISDIKGKIKELEKLQSKRYLGDGKEYNSIKSFGDGQVLSIKNMKDDIYGILVNGKCLSYDKKNNIDIKPCDSSKSQQFKLNNITQTDQYNNIITQNNQEMLGEFDGINYPFQMMNPIQHQSQCLTLNGNSIGVKECMNTSKQRWEGLKNIKTCNKL